MCVCACVCVCEREREREIFSAGSDSEISVVFAVQVSVDTLSWEFIVSTMDDKNLHSPPKVSNCCHPLSIRS